MGFFATEIAIGAGLAEYIVYSYWRAPGSKQTVAFFVFCFLRSLLLHRFLCRIFSKASNLVRNESLIECISGFQEYIDSS